MLILQARKARTNNFILSRIGAQDIPICTFSLTALSPPALPHDGIGAPRAGEAVASRGATQRPAGQPASTAAEGAALPPRDAHCVRL